MDILRAPDKGLQNVGHAEAFGLGQIVQVRLGEGGSMDLPAQNGQALAALELPAPLHPAEKTVRALFLHLYQQGAVVQGDAVSRLGSFQGGGGNGDAARAKHGPAPGLQRNGSSEGTHPQLRALQVDDEMGGPAAGAGGRPIDILQQGGALGKRGVRQIEPRPGHSGGKQPVQGGSVGAGATQSGIKFHGTFAPFFAAVSIMVPSAPFVNRNSGNFPEIGLFTPFS